eukprot:CAMPEP_0182841924 /NCGR_PEP_ID=MMETSP0006_2-20121128/25327_1 /TAXON_ID=97485 /ORGANISM="Prymnesium parvum, Strain Texoma1" /LENGTH=103 /DNA_ID=CAMNT_0024971509 /DNA_START=134 /DNA_END=442 /DNA_ORIENTATION=-
MTACDNFCDRVGRLSFVYSWKFPLRRVARLASSEGMQWYLHPHRLDRAVKDFGRLVSVGEVDKRAQRPRGPRGACVHQPNCHSVQWQYTQRPARRHAAHAHNE